ncbi:GNAT family N-acetyltransferase [Salipaludibacillus sp. CUR1]|uniref:GNAT family N-acetyltransferase n=1 Tax=Salipaludibacillus sp. CUR1 TaxID=2820003 RepID=UPI001E500079|nr:GNAT family N-acetyltransferase [Salipaludibacillus sp. CUR1]MCE7793802.1 GNAT family N-acetyltransferase [Salipaludibacillus sp. CUR1]
MRPYEIQDAESVFKVVKLKEIAETTISMPHPYPRETVDWWINFVRENMEKGNAYEFGLYLKDRPSEYVGNCGFVSVSKQHNHGELGYFTNPDHWNKGYSTEACSKLLEFGFNTLGLERVFGRCMAKNTASKRVMEKCGLKVEGIAKHEILKWDHYEDVIHLGLIRSKWD